LSIQSRMPPLRFSTRLNPTDRRKSAAFALRLMAKDLRLAKEQGLHTPGGLALEDSYRRAAAEGLGEEDLSAILRYVGKK